EWASAWALLPQSGGPLLAGRRLLLDIRPGGRVRRLPPLATAAALLALLAATQPAFPLSPVPAGQRNLLVAAAALASARRASWAWRQAAPPSPSRSQPSSSAAAPPRPPRSTGGSSCRSPGSPSGWQCSRPPFAEPAVQSPFVPSPDSALTAVIVSGGKQYRVA